MAKRTKKTQKTKVKTQEFVIIAFAEDIEQAREYESLLKTNDIPVVVKEQNNPAINAQGIGVMVPEDYFDEAHVIIESQDAYDDFYDFATEFEDGSDDFGDDLLGDDF